jgi:DNA-binding response OmpR family regulator
MSENKKTILVVEDEVAMLKAIVAKLEKEDFTVLQATDGESGFSVAKDKKPDLVILDIIMPKIDGLTVMKKIRDEGGDWGKQVPMIMLTNLSDPESVADAAKYKVFDFLVKTDWRLDDIADLVKKKIFTD